MIFFQVCALEAGVISHLISYNEEHWQAPDRTQKKNRSARHHGFLLYHKIFIYPSPVSYMRSGASKPSRSAPVSRIRRVIARRLI